ncbi:DUF4352 domain-containing protein [Dermacoccus nishinomiyaensis]|uniref:DUF4352 domain-containing protein n=1 Tax=Dermacoccus nishinomiyaensis TaxID=1274 RepID=UPI0011A49140|nr:DUF4352 domain-containing protein [Dermacoccus nishinomiyaensis]
MKTPARTMGLALLAGTMTLGMSACTQVEGGASQATSAANSAAPSVASAASSAAGEATSAAQSATSQASTPDQSSSAAAPTSDSPSSDTDSGDSGDASGPKTGKVGEEVKTKEMSAKVNKIADPVTPENDFDKPGNGNHFVAVNITMTNLGDKNLNAGTTCLKVKLDDNTSAREDFASYGQRLDYGTLYKGDTTTGDVVYKVPNGKKIKTIDVKCGYGDEQAIRIQAK